MAYKVLKDFKDLKDNGHFYRAGDTFPRSGITEISEDRIRELSSVNNKAHAVLIEKVVSQSKKGRKKNARANIEGDKELLHN